MKPSAILALAFPRPPLKPHIDPSIRRLRANLLPRPVSFKAGRGAEKIARSMIRVTSKLKLGHRKVDDHAAFAAAAACHDSTVHDDTVYHNLTGLGTVDGGVLNVSSTSTSSHTESICSAAPAHSLESVLLNILQTIVISASQSSASPTLTLDQEPSSIPFPSESIPSDLVAKAGKSERVIRRRRNFFFTHSYKSSPLSNRPLSADSVSYAESPSSNITASFTTARTSITPAPSIVSFSVLPSSTSLDITDAIPPSSGHPWPNPHTLFQHGASDLMATPRSTTFCVVVRGPELRHSEASTNTAVSALRTRSHLEPSLELPFRTSLQNQPPEKPCTTAPSPPSSTKSSRTLQDHSRRIRASNNKAAIRHSATGTKPFTAKSVAAVSAVQHAKFFFEL